MPAKILVATPLAAFGELIRQSLQEVGSHQVEVTGSAADAVTRCDRTAFDLAILDSDLKDLPIAGLGQAVLARLPRVRLVLIPPDNNPAHPRVAGLPALAYLNKPFYLPDLIETVERLLGEPAPAGPPSDPLVGAQVFPQSAGPAPAAGQTDPAAPDLLAELAGTAMPDPVSDPAEHGAPGPAAVFASPEPGHPLEDRALAGRRLARVAAEAPIWGALLLRGGQVWARAGQISPAAAEDVAGALARQWEEPNSSDLTRFLRLPSANRQVMVYAARLKTPGPPGLALALVYENMLSFIRARAQSARIGRELGSPELDPADAPAEAETAIDPAPEPAAGVEPIVDSPPEPAAALEPVTDLTSEPVIFLPTAESEQAAAASEPVSAARAPEAESLTAVFDAVPPTSEPESLTGVFDAVTPAPEPASLAAVSEAVPAARKPLHVPDAVGSAARAPSAAAPFAPDQSAGVEPARAHVFPLPDVWDIPEDEEGPPVNLPPLFDDVPPPDPLPYASMPHVEPSSVPHAWVQESSGKPAPAAARTDLLDEMPPTELRVSELSAEPGPEPMLEPAEEGEWLTAEPVDGEFSEPLVAIQPVTLPMETIRLPALATTMLLADRLDPLSADVYNLAFTCILVPRFPSHYLSGDLATQLSRWFPQICLAYSWRLEGLSVRPDHIQWVVRIPPTTSPASLLKIIRQQTSQRIFDSFPRLREDNPSAEFWAPGYLILSGVQTIAGDLLREFIRQTRMRQGIR